MMKRVVFVISGGEIADGSMIRAGMAELAPVAIVSADGGARHLHAAGVIPDIMIGDMDSLDPDLQRYFEGRGSRIIRHSKQKDETDTQLALEYALDLKPDEVRIFGALGGRLDHTLANLSLLALGAERGIPVKIIDEWCEIFLVTGRGRIEGKPGQTVSIFPFSGPVTGIGLEGFEYPLTNAAMEFGRPYGISNRLIGLNGIIKATSGLLLVIRYVRPVS
jgi:thiamine pyrophosphokinase